MSSTYLPFLRGILERRSGLDLGRGGMEANLTNFVRQRLNVTNLSFEQYLAQLEIPGSDELRALVETMTVVYTWFFRDPGQFLVIEELIRHFVADRALSIWVAGCATGEEAYSVALVAAALGKAVTIHGTDVNTAALEQARLGRYSAASLNAVDAKMRERYLGDVAGDFVIPDRVRQTVRFHASNLVDVAPRAPTTEGWDLIICRNVLIYFTPEQALRTLETFANGLRPGGHLVLGASEAILERPTTLNVIGVAGRAVLQRPLQGQTRVDSSEPNLKRLLPSLARSTVENSCPRTAMSLLGAADDRVSSVGASGEFPSATYDDTPERPDSSALQAARCALESGDIASAKRLCAQAVHFDPTCAEAAMFAGIAEYLDGDFAEAMRFLRGALCLNPTLWPACFYQALCFENIGCAQDAARSYSQVLRIVERNGASVVHSAFLDNWRGDLLAVARKRVHQLTQNRECATHEMRAQVR